MAVEPETSELDPSNISHMDDIVSSCCGLITIDAESNIVRLIHYTSKEYFERTGRNWFQRPHAKIAITCTIYFSFGIFDSGLTKSENELRERLKANRLLYYAAQNWGIHAREHGAYLPQVIEFLKSKTIVQSSSQVLWFFQHHLRNSFDFSDIHPKKLIGLHLAAYFGIIHGVQILLQDQNINSQDGNGRTPLSYAAEMGMTQ